MNIFSEKFKDKSNEDLQEIVNNPGQYTQQAIDAARELLIDKGEENTVENNFPPNLSTEKIVFPTDEDDLPQLRYIGYAGLAAGLITFASHWIAGMIIAIISILVAVVFQPVQRKLDLRKRTVSNISLLTKEVESFDRVDKLELSSTQVSQRVSSRASSSVIRYELFRAFLIANGQRILLGESKKKEDLFGKLKQIAAIEKVDIDE